MSYYINIDFLPNIPLNSLLTTVQSICQEDDKLIPERIQKNLETCSAHPWRANCDSFKEFSRTNNYRMHISNFIELLSQHTFFYYPQYNLLGILTPNSFPVYEGAVRVEFQNSCDQNYPLDTWNGIPLFEKIRDEMLAESSNLEDINEYDLLTSIYDRIEQTLEIEKFLNSPDDFTPMHFTISFINRAQHYRYYDMCRNLLNQEWKKWDADLAGGTKWVKKDV